MTGGKRIIPVTVLFLLMATLSGCQWGRFSLSDSYDQSEDTSAAVSDVQTAELADETEVAVDTAESAGEISEVTDTVEMAAASAVIVESGELRGSGNIWKAEKGCITVITAAHVIEDEENVEVTFHDGQSYRAETKLNDTYNDYCFLEVRDENLSLSSGLRCAADLPAVSESVFMVVLSRPDNGGSGETSEQDKEPETSVSAGVVISPETYSEDLSRNVLCCDIEVAEGMSGGGLFDAEGNYLGLLLGRSADGLGVFIPVSDIEQ